MPDAGQRFLQETRYDHLGRSDQNQGLPQPPLELPPDPECPVIELPRPESFNLPAIDLRTAIEQRRSLRAYSEQPLMLEELAWLLWSCPGVQKILSGVRTLRTVPSGGARHAFETYLLVNRVEGLEPGLYRYLAIEHQLQQLSLDPGIADRVVRAALDQEFLAAAAVTFIWVAVPYRMTWRYQERGYRYMLLDAGHACQNLYLAAEAIGCGACAVGAFDDALMDQALGLDGESRFVIYAAPVGKRK